MLLSAREISCKLLTVYRSHFLNVKRRHELRSLIEFIDHLNNFVPSIKFTREIYNSVNFLDTTILKDRQGISTDVYEKATDTYLYRDWTLAH